MISRVIHFFSLGTQNETVSSGSMILTRIFEK